MIHLIELQAHDGVALRTVYLATAPYTSKPTDTPANQFYADRLEDAGLFRRAMFTDTALRGASEAGHGDVLVLNARPYGYEELIDEWIDWAFDGHPIVIKTIDNDTLPLTSAVTVFTGVMAQAVSTDALHEFSLRFRDRLADLDRPLLTNRYLGTTLSGGTTPIAEGNADLLDRVKPKLWGRCQRVECVPVNIFDGIYQVSDGAVASIVVYDGGVPLTSAGNFSTPALLQAAILVPGQFATCLAFGLFRLGAPPQFVMTADVLEGTTAADRTAAQVVLRMLTHFGITAPEILTASFTALAALNSTAVGIRVDGERTALDAISEVLGYVGAWMAPDALGRFEVGRLDPPAGLSVASFDIDDNLDSPPQRGATGVEGDGVPVHRVTVRYDRVHFVQRGGDLAGVVSPADRLYLEQEFRSVSAQDPSVLTRFPNARQLTVDTNLATLAAATAEAARLLAMHSEIRDRYEMDLAAELADAVQIGSVVTLTSAQERLGLAAGKQFVCIARTDDRTADVPSLQLSLWG